MVVTSASGPAELLAAAGMDVTDSLGDPALLDSAVLGLLSSVRVPPDLMLPALELIVGLGQQGRVLLGGFQTPLERAIRDLLLRRHHRMVIALPRTLDGFRIPREWTDGIRNGQLLLIATSAERRITRVTAESRNRLIADLANELLVVHATPAGRAWRAASIALARGKRVWCCTHPANLELEILGATAISETARILSPTGEDRSSERTDKS